MLFCFGIGRETVSCVFYREPVPRGLETKKIATLISGSLPAETSGHMLFASDGLLPTTAAASRVRFQATMD